ncbi:MAG TPA: RNA polymerase sigma factor, partial [Candidatus Sulfotelmatobacter sp.]|nr:RNA polymerase sigma factor [Candidatus Sulfotelmatobacter sp.]
MTAVVQTLETLRMAPDAAEELALMERVTGGDESALQTLYDRYADPLFAYLYHAVDGARPEAEEIWQDTLEAAIRTLPSYRGQSRFFSWLCSIARHKLADHWRRQSRLRQHLDLMAPEDLVRLLDDGPLPDEIVGQRATCLRVVEVLGQLAPDYRTALVARYADGRSVEEIARLLDRSYKATESVLSRAKEAFRA